MDRLSPERRTRLMKRVRSKDSLIEVALRRALWSRGIRYRKHVRKLPGTPDIVIFRARIAIFVDSEFWHGYNWERQKVNLDTNKEFWIAKIERNIMRDREVNAALESAGWTVMRFWGKQIQKDLEGCIRKVLESLNPPLSEPIRMVAEKRKPYAS
ncbi:MAG: very short patch repair endonuclease [Fimbriimonadaceae bacterium]|nr:very short patch repair endonuclease [Fimbriimonadaceae bacterium]